MWRVCYQRGLPRLVDVFCQVTKAMISKPAPFFSGTSVLNGEFKELKLTDYLGKYLVFFFYPLDFTFVCPTEILAFNDRVQEFRKIGAEVGSPLLFHSLVASLYI